MTSLLRAYVNGEEGHTLPILDRGLHYGDGVFRTMRIASGTPLYWPKHIERLLDDAARIGLAQLLAQELAQLAKSACAGVDSGILKIILTRGSSDRGYQFSGSTTTCIMLVYAASTLTPAESDSGVRVRLCQTRLSQNTRLAGIKHLNRLEQVLARAEWQDPEIHEGLMLDTEGHLIEGVSSNLFLVQDGSLRTADLTRCGVAGVTRDLVLESARRLIPIVDICDLNLQNLYQADECFICNSVIGIRPIIRLDDKKWAIGTITRRLQKHFGELCLKQE